MFSTLAVGGGSPSWTYLKLDLACVKLCFGVPVKSPRDSFPVRGPWQQPLSCFLANQTFPKDYKSINLLSARDTNLKVYCFCLCACFCQTAVSRVSPGRQAYSWGPCAVLEGNLHQLCVCVKLSWLATARSHAGDDKRWRKLLGCTWFPILGKDSLPVMGTACVFATKRYCRINIYIQYKTSPTITMKAHVCLPQPALQSSNAGHRTVWEPCASLLCDSLSFAFSP